MHEASYSSISDSHWAMNQIRVFWYVKFFFRFPQKSMFLSDTKLTGYWSRVMCRNFYYEYIFL